MSFHPDTEPDADIISIVQKLKAKIFEKEEPSERENQS